MTMGHRVAVLKDGELQQVASPRELYRHPTNRFVAGFIGSPAMNLVDVERVEGRLAIAGASVPLADATSEALANVDGQDFAVGVRPEHMTITDGGIDGEVTIVEALGSESFLHVRITHQGEEQLLVVRAPGDTELDRGDHVSLAVSGTVHVFGPDGARVGP
jgi:multiple sugar transport system ATP-binding protein